MAMDSLSEAMECVETPVVAGYGNPMIVMMPSCMENPEHPYCVLVSCENPSTGGFDESCDYSVMIYAYTYPSIIDGYVYA